MRNANPELALKIKKIALDMLLQKEPGEITMRDIAKKCGITATTLYYYYKDKKALFEAVKLECLVDMNKFILRKTKRTREPARAIRAGLGVFRDWAFANPRIAILVMGRLDANKNVHGEDFAAYYQSNYLAKALLDAAVAAGRSRSRDTLLDSSLCIAAVWGAIESVLLNRTMPEYWDRGIMFTNKMIDLCCQGILK
jgi:AcrR family transcriptional regulator